MCARVDASSALCDHVQRQGLQGHLFSDITVAFQNKDYKLHRIILSQSSYFRSLLSGPWKESGKPRVELKIDDHNVTAEGLETAFSYMYGVTPTFSGDNVVGILAAGCFLCMENLCAQCVQFMVQDIREETFVAYQQLSDRHCYGRFADDIRSACWNFLCGHAARELAHVLPKLSLQLLCRLLKSDELWVPNETERYKLAKQALTDWKLARLRHSHTSYECGSSKRLRVVKASYSRKSARTTANTASSKTKDSQKNGKPSKEKSKSKKDASGEQKLCSRQREDVAETALRRLRRLWEEDTSDYPEASKEGFDLVVDLFSGGGIIFAYMDAREALQARKELEDANMPTDVVNDAIWQNVLLKARVFKENCGLLKSSSDEDEESSSDDEEDEELDEDEDDEDEEVDEDDDSSSDSSEEGFYSDRSNQEVDESGNANEANPNKPAINLFEVNTLSLPALSSADEELFDGERRKTTGGFSWAAKLDQGMEIEDFPPFRFGAEFTYVNHWTQVVGQDHKEAFYGGSMWKISVTQHRKESWLVTLECRSWRTCLEHYAYNDQRKVVFYRAKLYIGTSNGLKCVAGTGQRNSKTGLGSSKYDVGATLNQKDIPKNKPLRVAAVVQLIDSFSGAISLET